MSDDVFRIVTDAFGFQMSDFGSIRRFLTKTLHSNSMIVFQQHQQGV